MYINKFLKIEKTYRFSDVFWPYQQKFNMHSFNATFIFDDFQSDHPVSKTSPYCCFKEWYHLHLYAHINYVENFKRHLFLKIKHHQGGTFFQAFVLYKNSFLHDCHIFTRLAAD